MPEEIYGAVTAAGHGLVYEAIRTGRTSELPALEEHLLHVHLAMLATPALLRAARQRADLTGPRTPAS